MCEIGGKRVIYIYGLVDPITTELRYVGKSINPINRLKKHISERNIHDSYKDRWVRKLNDKKLKPELFIIDEVDEGEWVFWERHYIGYFKTIGCRLTNGTNGGDEPPSTKGRKHKEESKMKMSKTKSGKPIPWLNNGPRTEEHQKNLSKSLKGKKSPNKGKVFSEEYRLKLSEASTCKRSVKQLDSDGNIIQIWESIALAQKNVKNKTYFRLL